MGPGSGFTRSCPRLSVGIGTRDASGSTIACARKLAYVLRPGVSGGVKSHGLTDELGTPMVVSVTAEKRHDVPQLLPLIDAMPRCAARSEGPATASIDSSPVAPTTTTSTGASCAHAGSLR